jgi:hypothetical protein
MVHFIPLRKDFMNVNDVLELQADNEVRAEIAGNAYRDLIASRDYDVSHLVARVDAVLAAAGLPWSGDRPSALATLLPRHARRVQRDTLLRRRAALTGQTIYGRTPRRVLSALRAAKNLLAPDEH